MFKAYPLVANPGRLSFVVHDHSLDPTIHMLKEEVVQGIFGENLGSMRILIGSDHAGYDLKEKVKAHLAIKGIEVLDQGTHSSDSVDYPDFAHAVAAEVASGSGELGIVICGSGNGVNITANKHPGIRSALAWDPEVAALARQHNNANILALPARFIGIPLGLEIVDAFLAARFEGGRHQRRVDRIEQDTSPK